MLLLLLVVVMIASEELSCPLVVVVWPLGTGDAAAPFEVVVVPFESMVVINVNSASYYYSSL